MSCALRCHGAVALVFGFACVAAAPALGLEPVRSLLEMRRESVVMQEWDLSCGAAALATLLNYQHGDPVSEREIAEAMIKREKYLANPMIVRAQEGFSLLDLRRFAAARGYRGRGFGDLELNRPARTWSGRRLPKRAAR